MCDLFFHSCRFISWLGSDAVPSQLDFIRQVTHKAVFFAFRVFAAPQHGLLDVHIIELYIVLLQRVVEPPQEGDTH